MPEPLRLLIVDDSALMRRALRGLFESDPDICVVGEAANGREALLCVAELRPDVITMDVQMPVMNGAETVERLMAYHPTPVLVLTASLSRRDVDITFKMLDLGALDVMEKPALTTPAAIERARRELTRKVKLLARVKVVTHLRGRRRNNDLTIEKEELKQGGQGQTPISPPSPTLNSQFPVVVIGASTGGPRIVQQILAGLPHSFGAAVIVVQHVAEGFSRGMAEWLAETQTLPVLLAQEGMSIRKSVVLIAPDRANLLVQRNGLIHLSNRPLLLQHPAIDIAMQAVAEVFGDRSIGVLLTGMGRDGAIGMQSIRRAGGYTIAQNQASCTIYGMPRAAVEIGAANDVLSPQGIVQALRQRVKSGD